MASINDATCWNDCCVPRVAGVEEWRNQVETGCLIVFPDNLFTVLTLQSRKPLGHTPNNRYETY